MSDVRGSYFHTTPLVWVAAGSLAGATAADLRVGAVSLPVLAVVFGCCRLRQCHGARRARAMSVFLLSLALGTARGAFWAAKWAKTEAAAGVGPCQVVLLPVTPAVVDGLGADATFRASVHGDLVEVTIHARDAGRIREGVPIGATGRFALAPQAMNPGEFDLRRHLSAERTFATFECSRLDDCPASTVPWLLRAWPYALGALRRYVGAAITSSLPAEEGAVLKGIILGDRSGVPYEISLDFRRSGFYRFVTVAGFHVDLVFTLTESALRRLSRRPTASRLLAAALTCLHGSLSGWTPGVMRAFVCAVMRSFAPALRRRYFPLAGISLAAVIASWTVPFPLANAGLQLSFLGAIGGFSAARYVSGRRRAARFGVMLLFLVPVMCAGFGDVALAGLALGGFWAAAVSALVPVSACVVASPVLGRAAGWLPYLVIRGAINVSSVVSALPAASVSVPAPGKVEMAAHYGLLLVLADLCERKLRARAGDPGATRSPLHPVAALCCCLVLCSSALLRVYLPWPEVTFLSVGQGDCAVVRYKRTTVLVDTGTPGSFSRVVQLYLSRQGIRSVDLCVLSHLHQDHTGGFALLLQEVRTRAVLTSMGTGPEVAALLDTTAQIVEAGPGATYMVGNLLVATVCPADRSPSKGNENERSLVAVFQPQGGKGPSIEFWGDAPKDAVTSYLSRFPSLFAAEETPRVAKVPHHGSKDALSQPFYARLRGELAVVSVGPNSYGHPSKDVLDAARLCGVRLFRTDERGAVTARFLPFGDVVSTFR